MAEGSYWQRVLTARINRRRALGSAAAVGLGATALSLVGCGGGGSSGGGGGGGTPSGGSGTQGSVIDQDTTSQAKAGGVNKLYIPTDPPNYDPNLSQSYLAQGVAALAYSRLLKFQTGPGIDPLSKVTGDAASSFEPADNGQTWTFHLRQNMKFQPKGPASVSGRALTSDDVKASWDYMFAKNVNTVILKALVDSVQVPDKNTFVIKLKQPYAPFQELMASSSLFWVMPQQATTGEIDSQKPEGVIGTGPWILDNAQRSTIYQYKKSPNWYETAKISTGQVNLPLMDGVQYAVIPDPATEQAQFIAGNLDSFAPLNTDLVNVAQQAGSGTLKSPANPTWLLSMFYFNQDNPTNPFKDDRVRKAVSLAIDRDGLIDTFGNVSQLKGQGFTINTGWNSNPVPWGDGGAFWWLDPKGSSYGASAQWYKYDPNQAKQLLSAAGYKGDSVALNSTENAYGNPFNAIFEAQLPMLTTVGFKLDTRLTDYSGNYLPDVYSKGNYDNMAFGYNTPYATVDEYLFNMLSPQGGQNHSKINDQNVTDLVNKQRLELDQTKRQSIIYDIQRAVSDKMYYVPSVVGRWGTVTLYQAYMRNAGAFRTAAYGGPTETIPWTWIAKS